MTILLPRSALRNLDVGKAELLCSAFAHHFGHHPDEATTLREWAEAPFSVLELLVCAQCCAGTIGDCLAVVVASKAAWRALPFFEAKHPDDSRLRAALLRVDDRLAGQEVDAWDLRRGVAEARAAWNAAGDDISTRAAEAVVLACTAAGESYVAETAARACYCAECAIADDAADLDGAASAERAQQRADFISAIDQAEALASTIAATMDAMERAAPFVWSGVE